MKQKPHSSGFFLGLYQSQERRVNTPTVPDSVHVRAATVQFPALFIFANQIRRGAKVRSGQHIKALIRKLH